MTYLIPLTLFFILYAVITWRDLELGIFLLMMLLPSYLIRFEIGPLPSTSLEVMIVIVVLVWIIKRRKETDWRQLVKNKFFWPGVLLIAAAGLSIFWTHEMREALGIWKAYFVEPFLLYLVLVDVLTSKAQWRKVFIALGVTTVFLTIIAIIQRVTGWWSPTWVWTLPESRRVTGLFTSPNSLGLFVGPITALYVAWLFLKEKRSNALKWFQYLVVICGFLSILLAVSRGAMAALLIAVMIILFIAWSKKNTLWIGVIGIVIVLILPQTRSQVFEALTFQVDSGQSRIALYQGSWELIKTHPIAGTGLASFARSFEQVRPEGFLEDLIYPHNIFLNFWLETGLLGLIALIWMISLIAYSSYKHKLFDWQWLFIAAFITMLVHGLIDVPYFKNDLAVLTWVILAGFGVSMHETPSMARSSSE